MSSTSELKELERYIKKIDSNLFIWVIFKIMKMYRNTSKSNIYISVLNIVENCSTLTDIKNKAMLLIFDLKISQKEKIDLLNEIHYDTPSSEFLRQLKIIQSNKRLSDFIYYNLNSNITIESNQKRPKGIESLIAENHKDIAINELLIGGTTKCESIYNMHTDEKLTSNHTDNTQNLKTVETHLSNKKTIFHQDELVYFYNNNTSLLVNLELTDKYLHEGSYSYSFNSYMRTFEEIQKKSRTIIGQNIKKHDFANWLHSYIEKNIINCEIPYNIDYVPSNDEERTNLMLHQIDIWYLLDESRFDYFLKKTQSAWNKKTFDERKRALKDKK